QDKARSADAVEQRIEIGGALERAVARFDRLDQGAGGIGSVEKVAQLWHRCLHRRDRGGRDSCAASSVPAGAKRVCTMARDLRQAARRIWQAGVDAVRPEPLVRQALSEPGLTEALKRAGRILVLGTGKAGAAMATAVESVLADRLEDIEGWVSVPEGAVL